MTNKRWEHRKAAADLERVKRFEIFSAVPAAKTDESEAKEVEKAFFIEMFGTFRKEICQSTSLDNRFR